MATLAMDTGVKGSSPIGRLLGARMAELPPVVGWFHAGGVDVTGEGTLVVGQATSRLGRWVAHLVGLPRAVGETSVRLVIRRAEGSPRSSPGGAASLETWQRSFGGEALTSTLAVDGEVLVERVGRAELRYGLEIAEERLVFHHVGSRVRLGRLGLPIPQWLAPRAEASAGATATGDQLDISVRITAPGLGALLSYAGHLTVGEVI